MGNKNIFSKIKKYISKLLDSKLLIVIALIHSDNLYYK